jgi:hypothetical protein
MPEFLRCLMDNHKDLDDEALKLYREAEARALVKAGKSRQQHIGADEVAAELEAVIMEKIDETIPVVQCEDQETYDALMEKNLEWYANKKGEDMHHCALVQQTLQGVLSGCAELQIESGKKCADLRTVSVKYADHIEQAELEAKTIKGNKLFERKTSSEHQRLIEGNKDAPHKNKKAATAARQHQIACLLINAIENDKKSPYCRLQDFSKIFEENKKTIEASRDTVGDILLKVANTAIYLVKGERAKVPKLWKVKEKKFAGKVENIRSTKAGVGKKP